MIYQYHNHVFLDANSMYFTDFTFPFFGLCSLETRMLFLQWWYLILYSLTIMYLSSYWKILLISSWGDLFVCCRTGLLVNHSLQSLPRRLKWKSYLNLWRYFTFCFPSCFIVLFISWQCKNFYTDSACLLNTYFYASGYTWWSYCI